MPEGHKPEIPKSSRKGCFMEIWIVDGETALFVSPRNEILKS